jgi:hypothetical protein
MPRDGMYDVLRDALGEPGCAICRIAREAVQRYLDGLLYEDVTDVDLRARLRASHGFCREHAIQAAAVRDALGLSIIYQDILSSLKKDMQSAAGTPGAGSGSFLRRRNDSGGEGVARRLASHRACPACVARDEMTDAGLNAFIANVTDAAINTLFCASDGLCLPHLRRALAMTNDAGRMAALVEGQSAAIDRTTAELAEFIRKHDWRFNKEPVGAEGLAWQRAMSMVVGELWMDESVVKGYQRSVHKPNR